MNEEINKIIDSLEGCIGMFDYMITPIESNLLVSYIRELQQENQELIKEKIRLLVIIQKALNTNVINGEDMKFITKLHKELGSGINEI